jgi:hypothetical protein
MSGVSEISASEGEAVRGLAAMPVAEVVPGPSSVPVSGDGPDPFASPAYGALQSNVAAWLGQFPPTPVLARGRGVFRGRRRRRLNP